MYSSNHLHSHSNKVHPHHTQSNSMQDNFQQTKIGLPIYEVNMMNNPSQNIQPPFVAQNNNPNQINPSLPNPKIIYCIQIKPPHPNPEIIYCTTYNQQSEGSQNWIGNTQALRQIHSELNLAMPNLNLIGNLNLLSYSDMESKVISQIIQNNSNVPIEKIRQGKVVYCCTFLQQKIRKQGSILLGLLCLITTLVIAGYSIDMANHAYGNYIVIPYIVHMILWGVLLLFALYGILRCSYRVIYYGLVIALVFNIIYGFIVIAVTVLNTTYQNSNGESVYFELRLGIQIPSFFVSALVTIIFNLVKISMNRFLILVKELEENKIDGGCC